MKTYFRKNSSYLKKAFVASNFNEMCRLCLSEVDFILVPIFRDRQIPYQELIQYSVDVSVEEGDGLPTSVCKECLGMVEKSYLFKKKCQMNDSKLREHLRLLDLNEESKLNERFDDETDLSSVEIEDRKELTSTFLSISSTDDQNKDTNDKLNSPSHEEQTDEVHEFSTPDMNVDITPDEINRVENSQNEPEYERVPIIYENSSENNEEIKDADADADADDDDHFEVLKLSVSSKIKRYEREKNKPIKKTEENKIDDSDKTEAELIYLLCEDVQSTSKNCNIESEASNTLQFSTVNDDDTISQSEDEVKSNTTIVKVYSLVESDSDEDMEVALGGRELVAKSDRIEEIVELWDNDEDEIRMEHVTDEDDVDENDVNENQQRKGNTFLNEDWTEEIVEKTNGPFQVCVEGNGVSKTHEFYVIKKKESVSEFSEETPTLDNKKTAVVAKVINNCSICNASFESRSEIKDHMFSKHKDSLDYCTCTVCFKNFSCPNSLKRHMLVHTGTKPYSCEICKRRFSQSSILKRHRFTHNELKPFQCHFCKKSYTQKMNLLIHLRNHGFKGQKEKYKCNLCDKKFVHHSGLSRHLKLHKGEMSFCPLCNKSFTDSSAMLRHVRSIHKTDPLGS